MNTDQTIQDEKRYQNEEAAETIKQEQVNARANDIQLELVHSEGDFQEALFNALESSELIKDLHEKYLEGRRKDAGIELCEKIDAAMGEMSMELAKGEFE